MPVSSGTFTLTINTNASFGERTISENAPLSVRASKMTINEMLKDESQRDMEAIRRMSEICFNSADYKEGRTAFMEKRPPRFVGR